MKYFSLVFGTVLKVLSICVVVVLASTLCLANSLNPKTEQGTEQNKVSKFGEYRGYSNREYDGFDRESKYVPVRDGTRLAVDIYRPTKDGVRAEKKLPTLVWMTWYRRANLLPDGSVKSLFGIEGEGVAENSIGQARYYLEHGYTILAVDTRGSGASFGQRPNGSAFEAYALDSYDIIEWAADQTWSTGAVGMFGNSFMGHSQISAASAVPPSLKAILPGSHAYFGWWPENGLIHKSYAGYVNALERLDSRKSVKAKGMKNMDIDQSTRPDLSVAPVDGPRGKQLLSEALAEHEKTDKAFYALTVSNFYDVVRRQHQIHDSFTVSATTSDIPIYSFGGLYDWGAETPLLYFGNIKGAKKATIGPWTHGPDEQNDKRTDAHRYYLNVEGLRWFDYWLRGIDNGIMDEPSLHYAVIDADHQKGTWIASDTWPSADVQQETFFLTKTDEGTLQLHHDQVSQPSEAIITVDFTATTGPGTRYFDSNGGGPLSYPEMSDLNSNALVFTSAPLKHDIAIVGSPVIDFKMTGSAPDAQIIIFLEKVRADDGTSEFITDGKMKASWRTLVSSPSFNTFGWPQSDISEVAVSSTPPFNSEVATIRVALKPTGTIFEKGSRIQIAITGADADNWIQEIVSPAPELTLFMGPETPSKIILPIMHDVSKLSIKSWTDYSE